MNKFFLLITVFLISPAVLCAGKFEPYEIQEGLSYYSDEYTTRNGIAELGEEKNFEEVWQHYNYYEAIFDSQERIVVFNAYERGVIEFSETYHYDGDGRPLRKVVKHSDGSESIVDL